MLRAIIEFFRPEIKCQRVGHVPTTRYAYIEVLGGETPRAALTRYKATVPTCSRCKEVVGEPENKEYVESFTGYSYPTHWVDEMREKGFRVGSWINSTKDHA